jgi:uncharacterized membrane protein
VITFEGIYFCVASTVMGSLFLVLDTKKKRKKKKQKRKKKKEKERKNEKKKRKGKFPLLEFWPYFIVICSLIYWRILTQCGLNLL